jgi:hypothetical protein
MARELEAVGPENWESFIHSEPAAVLMLGKDDCEACGAWTEELRAFLAGAGDRFPGVRFGKMNLRQPGLLHYKKRSPWLAELDVLPYNVIYVKGEPVKQYAGGGIERLVNRLDRVLSGEEE